MIDTEPDIPSIGKGYDCEIDGEVGHFRD